ncbi:tail fiber domain-containing protein [Candidatus Binatia bacterium]|nr:tail fiber domain-containing protein [Candidatus Binatia bacterium]
MSYARLFAVVCLAAAAGWAAEARAFQPSFTYQGFLRFDGAPVNAACDFQFRLYGQGSGGSPLGLMNASNQSVVGGVFTMALTFGTQWFAGDDRYLEIDVRCPTGSGAYTTLSPRQLVMAAPYAIHAAAAGDLNCSGCIDSNQIPGLGITGDKLANDSVTSASIAVGAVTSSELAAGAVTGDKIGASSVQPYHLGFTPGTVTAVTAGAGLAGGTISTSGTIEVAFGTSTGTVAAGDHRHDQDYWRLGGNTGLSGDAVLGTAGNHAVEMRVDNARALRLQPGVIPGLVGGWSGNTAAAGTVGAVIAGGGAPAAGMDPARPNTVGDDFGVVGGGAGNLAGTDNGDPTDARYVTVGGGTNNLAIATGSTIGGGTGNAVNRNYGVVSGGYQNTADEYATVAGGSFNFAMAPYGTVGGGGPETVADPATGNRVFDRYGTVAGGGNNRAGSSDSDDANANAATVGGGGSNAASARGATVGGGGGNTAGGEYATVAGGTLNLAGGPHATIAGGAGNLANGAGSMAAGRLAWATHDGAFVWSDGSGFALSQGANSFNALASGGYYFYLGTAGQHCRLTSTAGWQCSSPSDRAAKTGFAPVDSRAVLDRVASLRVERWSYKAEDPPVPHIGPMAQEFHAAFGVGRNDTSIDTLDADGVALAAIQGLHALVREQADRLDELRAANAALAARIGALESQRR